MRGIRHPKKFLIGWKHSRRSWSGKRGGGVFVRGADTLLKGEKNNCVLAGDGKGGGRSFKGVIRTQKRGQNSPGGMPVGKGQ